MCSQDDIVFNCILQTVAAVNSARPEPGTLMLEWFWLADTGNGFSLNVPHGGFMLQLSVTLNIGAFVFMGGRG